MGTGVQYDGKIGLSDLSVNRTAQKAYRSSPEIYPLRVLSTNSNGKKKSEQDSYTTSADVILEGLYKSQ